MTQEQGNSILRTVLTLLGAFIAGGGIKLFGTVIDTAYWQEITGFALTLASAYWAVKTKEVNIEKWMAIAKQIGTFVGGILLAKGILTEQTFPAVLAFISAIVPLIYSMLNKAKAEQLQTGKIQANQLVTNKPK